MGVLNLTPDSFSDGGTFYSAGRIDLARVYDTASEMLAEGAVILDVGGESTRPGADPVPIAEELERVIPVLETLAKLDSIVSLDTRHAAVAAAGIAAGAHLINDVSAGADPEMLNVIADANVGYAIMHMLGTPQTMQNSPAYDAVVADVGSYLRSCFTACLTAGISAERLMVDPGFGFGKTLAHNLAMLRDLEALRVADRPVLVGLSRKSMLGAITGRDVDERMPASIAVALIAAQNGADVLRVHDVAATQDALKVFAATQPRQESRIDFSRS